jgi:DNA replication protein DnaC
VQGHTGKSFVHARLVIRHAATAFRALYRRAPRLFDELKLARADGTYQHVLARIARVDVLVIDDFAIAPIADAHSESIRNPLTKRREPE